MPKIASALLLLLIGAGLGASGTWWFLRDRISPAGAETPADATANVAAAPSSLPAGRGAVLIKLAPAAQEIAGIETAPLTPRTHTPEITAYGVFQEDPQNSFTLRAPLPGVLREPPDGEWPDVGQTIAAGTTVGRLDPRLTPAEQIDLASRLTQARADVADAEASLAAAKASYESKLRLNREDQAVSDRAVEEAEARVKSEQARLDGAQATVRLIEAAQADAGAGARPLTLTLPRGGIVVERAAAPGEAVEPGTLLLRVVSYDSLIAQVDTPLGAHPDPQLETARILPIAEDGVVLEGRRISVGTPGVTPDRGLVLLFRVMTRDLPLRPGMRLEAHLPTAAQPATGVLVPRSAIVRSGGRDWVFVALTEDTFERRPLDAVAPLPDGWFVPSGLSPDDRVVTAGAQVLLSEEQKDAIDQEEAASE